MALEIASVPRVFKFESNKEPITLPDPNPDFTTDEVMHFFSPQYPELTNATVEGPKIENDLAIYNFVTTIGSKG